MITGPPIFPAFFEAPRRVVRWLCIAPFAPFLAPSGRPPLALRTAWASSSSPRLVVAWPVLRVFCGGGCGWRAAGFARALGVFCGAHRLGDVVEARARRSPARLVCCAGLVWRIG